MEIGNIGSLKENTVKFGLGGKKLRVYLNEKHLKENRENVEFFKTILPMKLPQRRVTVSPKFFKYTLSLQSSLFGSGFSIFTFFLPRYTFVGKSEQEEDVVIRMDLPVFLQCYRTPQINSFFFLKEVLIDTNLENIFKLFSTKFLKMDFIFIIPLSLKKGRNWKIKYDLKGSQIISKYGKQLDADISLDKIAFFELLESLPISSFLRHLWETPNLLFFNSIEKPSK